MLVDAYHAYQDAQARTEQARAAFIAALETEREHRTLRDIAGELGLSYQRVHAILKSGSAAHARAHNPQEETL